MKKSPVLTLLQFSVKLCMMIYNRLLVRQFSFYFFSASLVDLGFDCVMKKKNSDQSPIQYTKSTTLSVFFFIFKQILCCLMFSFRLLFVFSLEFFFAMTLPVCFRHASVNFDEVYSASLENNSLELAFRNFHNSQISFFYDDLFVSSFICFVSISYLQCFNVLTNAAELIRSSTQISLIYIKRDQSRL